MVEALETGHAYTTLSLSTPSGGGENGDDLDPLESLGEVDPEFELSEDRAVVEPGLRALDERERRILHLRFYEGLTQSQIAAQIGISQMHVSRLIRRVAREDADDEDAERGSSEENGGEVRLRRRSLTDPVASSAADGSIVGVRRRSRNGRMRHGTAFVPRTPERPPTAVRVRRMTRRAARGIPRVLRVARAHAARRPARSIPPADDPTTLFIVAGMQPMKQWFLGVEQPRRAARHDRAEGDARRREAERPRRRRAHVAPRLVLRDARQLLVRRLLQGRRDRPRLGVRPRSTSASTRTRSGRPSSPAIPSSGSARTRSRSTAGSASASRASGSSGCRAPRTSGRPADTGPCGPVLGALPRPRRRARLRPARLRARLRLRPLPRVLEPRLHGVRPCRRRHAHAAAAAEHRHRASASSAARCSSRASTRSSRPTATSRSWSGSPPRAARATASPSRRRRRTACSPTTAAR